MLLLYALARPLVASTDNETSLPSPEVSTEALNSCFDTRPCRTVEKILYSCIAVVFACTWIAIHPNIPRHFDLGRDAGAEGIICMLLSLLALELIVFWALRQWFVARHIAEKYRRYGWTEAHGHFLIMGGWALFQ
ncbi:hypothetical protein K435DRAFT_561745, partial [Dendrothele bispora CBS 962.96]